MSFSAETYALLKNKIDKDISEIDMSMVKTVNGFEPDEDGNVIVDGASAVDDVARNTANTLKRDIVLVQDEQPTSSYNRIWLETDTEEITIPEIADIADIVKTVLMSSTPAWTTAERMAVLAKLGITVGDDGVCYFNV